METQLDELLVKMYGNVIIPKLEQIKEKIALVITAEVYAEQLQSEQLLSLKKILDDFIVALKADS